MNSPKPNFDGQNWQLQSISALNPKPAVRKGQNNGKVERLAMRDGASCRKGRELSRQYECTPDGVKTIRMFCRKETGLKMVELSSRETTHRSSLQPLGELETHRISLGIHKLQGFLVRTHLKPSLAKIKSAFPSKHAGSGPKRARKEWRMDERTTVLSFPLLNGKLDDVRLSFLTKLELQFRCVARPYQFTIIFLLIRLQARLRFTRLERAMQALKDYE